MTTPAAVPTPAPTPSRQLALVPFLLPLACLVWAYWTTLVELVQTWNTNPQYSHGFLVPGFAAFLLWMRRDQLDPTQPAGRRARLAGAALLLLGLAIRLVGTWRFYDSADAISIVPCVAGLVLLVGGWPTWRWAWPAVLFLGFMIPLPFRLATSLSAPLQHLATVSSTFVMQTLGMPALAEGNVILLNDNQIGIVEACSGLNMLVVFIALATAVVFLGQRHWIDQALILASAIPIALVSNITRITTTGIMYDLGYGEMANHFFHDVAGWLMMPLALVILWAELQLLSRLFIEVPAAPAPRTAAPRAAARRLPASSRTTAPRVRRQPKEPSREPGRKQTQLAEPTAEKS